MHYFLVSATDYDVERYLKIVDAPIYRQDVQQLDQQQMLKIDSKKEKLKNNKLDSKSKLKNHKKNILQKLTKSKLKTHKRKNEAKLPRIRRDLAQFGSMIHFMTKRDPLNYNRYGNYCGWLPGGGPVLDSIDQ